MSDIDYLNKIKTLEEIKEITAKSKGKKVTINGSFDLMHAGHITILTDAKKQGDILFVGLNSDKSVQEWKKFQNNPDWPNRPIIPGMYRAEMLAALECVDYVTFFDELEPHEFIKAVKPDIHANGSEYGENCIEKPTVEACGGRIYLIPRREGLSTSEIIKKIRSLKEA